MTTIFLSKTFFLRVSIFCLLVSAMAGCAVEAAKVNDASPAVPTAPESAQKSTAVAENTSAKGPRIEIEENSPADTMRAFYKHLRENKLRDATFLTNMRPGIEGLTDAELAELQIDLAPLAKVIPEDIQINGEIISGDYATVTARLPDNETKKVELQRLRLRKEGNYWIILTVDEQSEPIVKQEGNKYFFNLRIRTHEAEAQAMMERISKAQMVYAIQNNGLYGEMPALVESGFLPSDILSAESTGYNYRVSVAPDRSNYFATAVPAVYGKTGKLSLLLELDEKKKAKFAAKDVSGAHLKE